MFDERINDKLLIRSLIRKNEALTKLIIGSLDDDNEISYVKNLIREVNSLHRKLDNIENDWRRYCKNLRDELRTRNDELAKCKDELRKYNGDYDRDFDIKLLRDIKESQEEQIQELLQEIESLKDEMDGMCKGCYYKDKIHEIEEALE